MSDAVSKFIKSYQGLIILAVSGIVGFSAGWFGNQYAVQDLKIRVDKLESATVTSLDKIQDINQNLAGINAKLDLLLGGKIK